MANTSTPAGVLVMYSTRHGHTRTIADFVAAELRSRGLTVDVRNVLGPVSSDLAEYRAVVLAGSVHFGRHASELVAFVRRHRGELERMPSAFLSVSLTEGTFDSVEVGDRQRRRAGDNLQSVLAKFYERSGWRPRQVWNVAGAVTYTRYNFFVRWMMKRIARAHELSTDTSRDHTYTNWSRLAEDVERFAASFHGASAEQASALVSMSR